MTRRSPSVHSDLSVPADLLRRKDASLSLSLRRKRRRERSRALQKYSRQVGCHRLTSRFCDLGRLSTARPVSSPARRKLVLWCLMHNWHPEPSCFHQTRLRWRIQAAHLATLAELYSQLKTGKFSPPTPITLLQTQLTHTYFVWGRSINKSSRNPMAGT